MLCAEMLYIVLGKGKNGNEAVIGKSMCKYAYCCARTTKLTTVGFLYCGPDVQRSYSVLLFASRNFTCVFENNFSSTMVKSLCLSCCTVIINFDVIGFLFVIPVHSLHITSSSLVHFCNLYINN